MCVTKWHEDIKVDTFFELNYVALTSLMLAFHLRFA